ncbi:MAG TPA: glycoside hydrolase family 28 protein [Ferruginibacter sp.]|nr:glycoside hydrolase family 28 protein [Ferruginibacter sp.]HMP20429.1 glycoside hydrolase family 28 protein [Ferruginibacter sp.]
MKKIFTAFTCSLIALILIVTNSVTAQEKNISYYRAKAPFAMPDVALPNFADKTFSIKDFGGVNDGKTLNTQAFAKAIEACSDAGGGKVIVPAGTWLSGPVEMKSNINLHLEKGAVIQFTSDRTQYPIINISGDNKKFEVAPPLYAYRAHDIAITGEGIIDGAGESWRPVKKSKVSAEVWSNLIKTGTLSTDGKIWWPSAEALNGEAYLEKLKKGKSSTVAEDYLPARDFMRPHMIYFVQCKKILVEGVTIRNSPKFVFYPGRCTDITMNGVTVFNEWWAQNGDGIDISACTNVVIYNCTLSVGDDGICMKSSRGAKAAGEALLKNILIAKCTVYRAHGGFVIGSNTDGGMENIYVSDCSFIGSDIGIRVKSNPGRGGIVKDIYIENITMKDIKNEAILFTTSYEDVPAGKEAGSSKEEADGKIPEYSRFYISNVTCDGAARAVFILGLKEMPIHDIYMENMQITSKAGFISTDAKNIFLKNVTFNTPAPVFKLTRSENIQLNGKVVE